MASCELYGGITVLSGSVVVFNSAVESADRVNFMCMSHMNPDVK